MTTAPLRFIWGTAGHGGEVGKDKEDVEDPIHRFLLEGYFSYSIGLFFCMLSSSKYAFAC
jgi:hypothetical protein